MGWTEAQGGYLNGQADCWAPGGGKAPQIKILRTARSEEVRKVPKEAAGGKPSKGKDKGKVKGGKGKGKAIGNVEAKKETEAEEQAGSCGTSGCDDYLSSMDLSSGALHHTDSEPKMVNQRQDVSTHEEERRLDACRDDVQANPETVRCEDERRSMKPIEETTAPSRPGSSKKSTSQLAQMVTLPSR